MKQVLGSATLLSIRSTLLLEKKRSGSYLFRSLLLLALIIFAGRVSATNYYVDSTAGNNSNAGTSWALAYKTLAYAVNQAHSNTAIDTILVAKGTYYPEYIAGNGTSNKNRSFTFTRDNLVILGGYASGGGTRNRDLYPTILSGTADTTYHVVVVAGSSISNSLKLHGMNIVRGIATSSGSISVNGSSILDNRGGGIHIASGSPLFSDISVRSNLALEGGGVYDGGCPTFFNCIIVSNTAVNNGGGGSSRGGCTNINQCVISSNNARFAGGWAPGEQLILSNTVVSGNMAQASGGGLYIGSGGTGHTITNAVITGNSAVGNGGGIQNFAPVTLTNTTLAGNTAGGSGLQMYNASSVPTFKNCIVWGGGGNSIAISASMYRPVFANCILDGSGGSATWNTSYGIDNGNNTSADPMFVNYVAATAGNPTVSGNFRVSASSPAINRGENSFYTSTDMRDVAGLPRFMGDTIDIGAYEQLKLTGRNIYVDSAIVTQGNGSSWQTAIRSLAEAINVAHDGNASVDSIFVAKGTYYPEYQAGSTTGIREKSFTITRKNLVILGGYPTGGGVRHATANPSVMSGARDNNYHVLMTMGSNIDTTLKLDGFTVTKGNANGGTGRFSVNGFDWIFYNRGGGWFNGWGSPMLSNFVIISNSADQHGGGVAIEGNPVVRNFLITNNTAYSGAGWVQVTGNTKADNLTVSNNTALQDGGGWYNWAGSSTITNSTLNNNTAIYGGGFYNSIGNPVVSNATIRNNTATTEGGGWFNYDGDPVINASFITGNTAGSGGGWYERAGRPSINNLLLTGNVATTGGGLFNGGALSSVTNSTIASNYATTGREVVTQNTVTAFRNTIIWNTANSISALHPVSAYTNCIVAGSGGSSSWNTSIGINYGGNIDANPLFINSVAASAGNPVATGDYRLQSCSPAINAGVNLWPTDIPTDITGRRRVIAGTVDMGAYEMIKPTGRNIYVDSAITTEGNGSSWATATKSLADAIKLAHDACTPIDSIFIAKGTYYPSYLAGNGTNVRDKAFVITRDTLVILGGYPNGGGTRNAGANTTVLSGDIGIVNDLTDNAYHVLITAGANIDSTLKIDGVTIRSGNANGSGSSITINGYTAFQNNRGGGWFNGLGAPLFTNVKINNNRATDFGAGVANAGNAIGRNLDVSNNVSTWKGGGWANLSGDANISSSTISNNSAVQDGGGWLTLSGSPVINTTRISGNTATYGGGFYSGGGTTFIRNSLITGNAAGTDGGGWFNWAGNSMATNTTISGNTAQYGSEFYSSNNTIPELRNCIIWNATSNHVYIGGNPKPVFANSIIAGSGGSASWNTNYGTNNGGNLDTNPLFVGGGNYALQYCSPAINAGSNAHVTNLTDLANNQRTYGTTVDMGAYEFQLIKPAGNKIYVDSAAANGNGDSWATATRSLAEAVNVAHQSCTSIDTILVAKGTYYPEYLAGNGTTSRHKSFTFTRDSLVIMGGYASGGATRDRDLYPTILSGARDQNAHVVLIVGGNIGSSLKFSGIDITGGSANITNGQVTVNGITTLTENGGGIYIHSSSPVFSDIKVNANSSIRFGGGIYSLGCPTFLRCTVTGNTAGLHGGGIYADAGCIALNESVISLNAGGSYGGGLHNSSAKATVDNTIIRGNSAGYGGGAYYSASSAAGCTMNNVVVSGNNSNEGAGLNIQRSISVTNATISGNGQPSSRQIYIANSSPDFKNSIIWGTGTNSVQVASGTPVYTNCIIDGSGTTTWNSAYGTNGGNNSSADPLFVTGDYRLKTCSPAINGGNNSFYTSTVSTDLAGRPRIMGDTIDIGAYETVKPTGHKIYVDIESATNGNGDSWATATRSLAEAVNLAHESCTAIDTILVAKGTYYPEYTTGSATANRDRSFTFTRDSLVIMGGYVTGGTARNRSLYPAILSGAKDSSRHVVFIAGNNIDNSLHFDGIEITGGMAKGSGSRTVNGFSANNNRGGGVYLATGSPVFSNLKIASNYATLYGAGIFSNGCPTLINCIIADNIVSDAWDTPGATGNGGGLYSSGGCIVVDRCIIESNRANLGSVGGLYNIGTQIKLSNTIIRNNWSRFVPTGMIHAGQSGGSTMHNVLITGNSGFNSSTALGINAPLTLTNVTVSGNAASEQLYVDASADFRNCIVWGGGNSTIRYNSGTVTYANSILDGSGGSTAWNASYGTDNGNNKNTNPLFINPGAGDYRLQFCSPAINAGTNTVVGAIMTDLAGNPRTTDGTVDIGAYEKQSTTTAGNFGSNASLSNYGGNASPAIPTSCEDNGWTYYSPANNPDSLSFAILWGTGNNAAKATAQIQLMLDTNNALATAGSAAITTMKRYWNVNMNGSTLAAPVSVRFFYNPADTLAMYNDLTGQSIGVPGNLRWFKTNSGAYNPSMVSAADVNGGDITILTPVYGAANNIAYAEFGNINSFSGGTAVMGISARPLPVQLIDFTATRTKPGQVLLHWQVADEQLRRYVVMRSRNAMDFQPIGHVQASGKSNYTFADLIDESSFTNSVIYYRLALEEQSGLTAYSKIVRVNIGDIGNRLLVSPNPVQNVFTITQVETAMIGKPIHITDATGKLVERTTLEEGIRIDASQWASGVYFLKLPDGEMQKLIKL